MKGLTDEQIRRAAALIHPTLSCETFLRSTGTVQRADIEVSLRAVAPLLQLPQNEPSSKEILDMADWCRKKGVPEMDVDLVGRALRGFVSDRNEHLLPKPVDNAPVIVSKMLRDRSLDSTFDEYAAMLVAAVREADKRG